MLLSLPTWAQDAHLRPAQLEARLRDLQGRYPGQLEVWSLGSSLQGRPLWACRVGNHGPGLLALNAQHSYEHDMTTLSLALLEEALRPNSALQSMLQSRQLVVVPMANPDGVEQDLTGKPFSWGRNHRGVNLNRNWGFHWNETLDPAAQTLATDPASAGYRGPSPFSEPETVALRDFIQSWPALRLVVDYHSGEGQFMQGMVHYPYSYSEQECLTPERLRQYDRLTRELCEQLTDREDPRVAFFPTQVRGAREFVLKAAPPELRERVDAALPLHTLAPGAAIDWVESQGKSLALALECSRRPHYFTDPIQERARMTRNHIRALQFLLTEMPISGQTPDRKQLAVAFPASEDEEELSCGLTRAQIPAGLSLSQADARFRSLPRPKGRLSYDLVDGLVSRYHLTAPYARISRWTQEVKKPGLRLQLYATLAMAGSGHLKAVDAQRLQASLQEIHSDQEWELVFAVLSRLDGDSLDQPVLRGLRTYIEQLPTDEEHRIERLECEALLQDKEFRLGPVRRKISSVLALPRPRRLQQTAELYAELDDQSPQELTPWAAARLVRESWAPEPAQQLQNQANPACRRTVISALRTCLARSESAYADSEMRLGMRLRLLRALSHFQAELSKAERTFLAKNASYQIDLLSP